MDKLETKEKSSTVEIKLSTNNAMNRFICITYPFIRNSYFVKVMINFVHNL